MLLVQLVNRTHFSKVYESSGGWVVDSNALLDWPSAASVLTRVQRRGVIVVLSGRSEGAALKAAIELGVDEARRCRHCAPKDALSRGKAQGLRRYRCKGCGRPKVDATAPTTAFEPVVAIVALEVSGGGTSRPPCVAALRVSREALNRSVGEPVWGNLPEQTVNCRHSRLKDFLRARRGIITRYLEHCLRSFSLVGTTAGISDRASFAGSVIN
jgi:transposase-like protein